MLEKIKSEYFLDKYFFEIMHLLKNNLVKNTSDRELKNQKNMLERASIAEMSNVAFEDEEFENIIDNAEIQLLMDDFYDLTKLGIAIIDLQDNILVATGWMDICTKFHRAYKESCKNCMESDIFLTSNSKSGQHSLYKCKNNMWDVSTPIIIGGKHLGNLFFGQFFFDDEVVDYDIFNKQAEKFGYDKKEYIAALERVPRYSREEIEKIMKFYKRFAQMIANLSYSNLMLAKSLSNSKHTDIKLKKSYEKLQETLSGTINALASIVETKDPYTAGHQKNVEKLAVAVARELNLEAEKIRAISIAALIHDIGKIAVPASILSKPTKLTEIEFRMVKEHSEIGYNFLKDIEFGLPVAEIIHQHHERLDGSGYPAGLKGDKIMIEAMIISVADTVEAMASHRPYRPAIGLEKALEEITAGSNTIYDSSVVQVCVDLFKNMQFSF